MRSSVLLFIGAALCSGILHASPLLPVYANFDAQHPYGAGSALSINLAVAVPFVTPATGVEGFTFALSDIEFVAFTTELDANPVTVALYDSTGGLPGTALESFAPSLDTVAGLVTVTSVTNPVLISSRQYWIVLSDPLSFDVSWIADGNGATSPASLQADQSWVSLGDSYTQGAVQVNGTLVPIITPESPTFLAFGGGLSAIFLLSRRRIKK
jgi:hypothetical protein